MGLLSQNFCCRSAVLSLAFNSGQYGRRRRRSGPIWPNMAEPTAAVCLQAANRFLDKLSSVCARHVGCEKTRLALTAFETSWGICPPPSHHQLWFAAPAVGLPVVKLTTSIVCCLCLLSQVNAARRGIVQGRKLLQLLEPCLLALLWSSMGLLLPMASPCVAFRPEGGNATASSPLATNQQPVHVPSWQIPSTSSSQKLLLLAQQPRQAVQDEHLTAGLYFCNPRGTSSIVPAEDQQASTAAAGQLAAGLDRSRGAADARDRLAATDAQPHYNVLASLMLSGTEKALQQVINQH